MHKTLECSPIFLRLFAFLLLVLHSYLYTPFAFCLRTFQGNTNCTCIRNSFPFFQAALLYSLPAYFCLLTYRYFYLSAYFSFPYSFLFPPCQLLLLSLRFSRCSGSCLLCSCLSVSLTFDVALIVKLIHTAAVLLLIAAFLYFLAFLLISLNFPKFFPIEKM